MIRTDFTYEGWVNRVIDADTLEVSIIQADYGFHQYKMTIERLRLKDFDAWEIRHQDRDHKAKGIAARDRVIELTKDTKIRIRTFKTKNSGERKTFERYVADVFIPFTNKIAGLGLIPDKHAPGITFVTSTMHDGEIKVDPAPPFFIKLQDVLKAERHEKI